MNSDRRSTRAISGSRDGHRCDQEARVSILMIASTRRFMSGVNLARSGRTIILENGTFSPYLYYSKINCLMRQEM